MPKHGFMTPKAISNRIKAKGLLKLRWYCQMCEKSCRDENGFKCHCMSEAHLRQMALYRENPNQFLSNYSREFENGFMSIVKIKGRSRVLANAVYQDYIRERHHTHMKATRWQSLAQFVQYLGKEGKVIAEETPKGWYITYIDRDPEVMARQRADERKERMRLDEVQRNERMIQKQMEQNSDSVPVEAEQKESVFQREDESQKIVLSMKPAQAPAAATASSSSSKNIFGDAQPSSKSTSGSKRKPSAVHDLMMDIASKKRFQKPEPKKEPIEQQKHWVTEGIIVKVLNKKLKDGALYKQKGEVLEVLNGGIARVRLLSGNRLTLRIAEKELESVLPAFDRPVMILRGSKIGRKALLRSIDERKFRAEVELVDGDEDRGKTLSLDFEDISKLAS